MTPTCIQAILFDFDGTLVDSEGVHFGLWAQVLRPHGIALSADFYQNRLAGLPTAVNACDLVHHFGLAVDPATLVAANHDATRAHLAREAFPLMRGVHAAIEQAQRLGLRVAIVTGAPRVGLDLNLQAHGLVDRFETTVSANDVVNGKPAPDGYRLAMQRLGLQPDDCIAVEDTEHGLGAAHAAGVRCLAVPTALSRQHDFSRAAAVLSDLREVMRWIAARQHAGD